MNVTEQAKRVLANLLQLGGRKLAALGAVGALIFAVTAVGGYYLSRPASETLYAGLDRQDVSSIGAALRDADIPFDVSADGTAVLVRYGQTAQARMLLAEKGLPHSTNAGYELYDKLGSLGLTSFMQDVTRVRALEGELARTIQQMAGVKAARVHLVMPDEGSFRRASQPASASVVIRMASADDTRTAQAIRHLVAAAVPGMKLDEVTVLSTDGALLASGDDTASGAPNRMLDLEKMIGREVGDNIRKTLVPSLGPDNLQISVTAKLNTDTRQTAETTYNPDGRVERSVRTVKDTQNSQNSSAQAPTSVGQNLPTLAKPPAGDGKQSAEQNEKREELTNYEISSKTVTTNSAGYAIEHLAVAVVLNRAALQASLGEKATAADLDRKLADVEQLVATAAGIEKARGDTVKVMAVDFVGANHDLDPVPTPSLGDALVKQSGTLINAAVVLGVTVLVMLLGVRPLLRVLSAPGAGASGTGLAGSDEAGGDIILPDLPDPSATTLDDVGAPQLGADAWSGEPNLIEDLTSVPRRSPQKRLEQMIEFDEEQAAAILKQWMHVGAVPA